MRILIEKKAKYTMTALIIMIAILITANALAEAPVFYNTLGQIAVKTGNTKSVDENNNGIIDLAERAETAEISVATGISAVCPDGMMMRGMENGNPICTMTKITCKYSFEGTTERDDCYLSPTEEITTTEEIPQRIQITIRAEGPEIGSTNPANIIYDQNLLSTYDAVLISNPTIETARNSEYCSVDNDPGTDYDWMCITEIHKAQDEITLEIYYSSYGTDNIKTIYADYAYETKTGTVTKQIYTNSNGAPTGNRDSRTLDIIFT
jgi:hypothetical protein